MAASILVPIDFSDVTEAVLDEAARLAKAFDAKIWLIHVASIQPAFDTCEVFGAAYARHDLADQLHEEHRTLERYQETLRRKGLDAGAMLVTGRPACKIVEEARRLEVDQIVLGSPHHGHGVLYGLLIGGVCRGVLRTSPCPVVVVPSRTAARTADVA